MRKLKNTYLFTTIIMALLIIPLITGGCAPRLGYKELNAPGHMKASYTLYSGSQRSAAIQVDKGQSLYLAYNSEVEKGSLSMAVVDGQGQEVMNLSTGKRGVKEVKNPAGGQYFLVVRAEGSKGFFDIFWEVR